MKGSVNGSSDGFGNQGPGVQRKMDPANAKATGGGGNEAGKINAGNDGGGAQVGKTSIERGKSGLGN